MRLSLEQRTAIRKAVKQVAGSAITPLLFGSRLDDSARGGDVDILLKTDTPVENPAWLIAQAAAAISIALDGIKVDVVLSAPNLRHQPIHEVALRDGIAL